MARPAARPKRAAAREETPAHSASEDDEDARDAAASASESPPSKRARLGQDASPGAGDGVKSPGRARGSRGGKGKGKEQGKGKGREKGKKAQVVTERSILTAFLLTGTELVDSPTAGQLRAALPAKYKAHPSLPALLRALRSQRSSIRDDLLSLIKHHCASSFELELSRTPVPPADDGEDGGAEREEMSLDEVVRRLEADANEVGREVREMERRLDTLKENMDAAADGLLDVPTVPTDEPQFEQTKQEAQRLMAAALVAHSRAS